MTREEWRAFLSHGTRTGKLATVRRDGRPHVVPVDGLWIDGRWYFGGSPTTVKHRNLLANPHATVHLDHADMAVIVDGRCEITTPSPEMARHLVNTSNAKYGFAPPIEAYLSGVWTLVPSRAVAWTDLAVDATRFVFA
jgi:nitroimidazol reductase NimA-like FMN-containing flavoprotein (pyridoxamine 5'-phosphate oxidase superfamily)